MDEEEISDQENNFVLSGPIQFNLPPHLKARMKKRHHKKVQTNGTQEPPRVLQSVENVQPQLLRRDTFYISKAPLAKPQIAVRDAIKEFNGQVAGGQQQQPNATFDQSTSAATPKALNKTVALNYEEEDARYINWLNSAIMVSFNIENINIDLQRIINDVVCSADSGLSAGAASEPLKDGVSSIAYKEQKLMDALRVKARQLYDEKMKDVEELLNGDLNAGKFYIRKDKNIHADVGAKKHIVEIFLNYNPLWLKVALEVIFNTRIEKGRKRSEVHVMLSLLSNHLLSFKEIAQRKGFKNVSTYFMKETNVAQAKRHILYHFLLLVHFLDVGKRARLIDHDPCLFRIDAEHKSSRDIVVAFSREYITGVGDITKALRGVGIHLEHVQRPIEQFNFTVTRLASDIRDGVRLARLAEIMLQRNDILPRLQFPPDSISRKIHNMDVVFHVFAPHFRTPLKGVLARDVANGSRSKTIMLLDKLIEVDNERLRLLELKQHEQFALKIQRWWRRRLECKSQRAYFLQLRSTTIAIQRRWRENKLAKEIRVSYLEKKRAILVIQTAARGYLARQKFARLRALTNAALVVQRRFRANQQMKQERAYFLQLRSTTIAIQRRWRDNQLAKEIRVSYLEKKRAILVIQTAVRGYLARQKFARLQKLTSAALTLQRRFRANQQMKQARAEFLVKKRAAVTIQCAYRAWVIGRKEREEFLILRQATITIQRRWRENQLTKEIRASYLEKKRAILVIQTAARGYLARQKFARLRALTNAATVVQRRFRANQQMKQERAEFLTKKRAAVTIQCAYRAWVIGRKEREEFLRLRQATITIQRLWREKNLGTRFFDVVERYYELNQIAALKIQSFWRAYRVRREMDAQMPPLAVYRERINAATQAATPERCILSQMYRILDRISRVKSINSLYKDLETIEFYTDVSSEICHLILVNDWLIGTLLGATGQLNRSEPHKKLLSNVLGILLNLVQKTATEILYRREDMFKMAMKVIRDNAKSTTSKDCRTNSCSLNSRAISLLLFILRDEDTKRMFKSDYKSLDFLLKFLNSQKAANQKLPAPSNHRLLNDSLALLALLK